MFSNNVDSFYTHTHTHTYNIDIVCPISSATIEYFVKYAFP